MTFAFSLEIFPAVSIIVDEPKRSGYSLFMVNTQNAAANKSFAADIQQMMNDWNAATPKQREEALAYAAALAAKAGGR